MENNILNKIQAKREKSRTTAADIRRIMAAMKSGDWSKVHRSRLYTKHSGEYCELLQFIPTM